MSDSKTFDTWEAAVAWLRNQPGQMDLVRAAYYDDPLVDASQRYRDSLEWQEIHQLLKGRTGSALDVGAGRGIASYALAADGFMVTALEPDPSDLVGAGAIRALARATHLPITTTEEFSERLPYPDGSFDVVFARAVLHHTSDLDAACREIFRVLRKGGRFVAVREHVISRKSDLPAFLEAHPLHRLYGGENAFLLPEYLGAMTAAGFAIKSVLHPLRSAVNYAPQTREGLRQELIARAARIPGGGVVLRLLTGSDATLSLVLAAAGLVDARPGRLYSFVCDKP